MNYKLRTVIIFLRSIVFLLLLICILDPIIKFTLSRRPYLLVLVDTSKSMGVGERLEKIKQILPLIKQNKIIYGFDVNAYLVGTQRAVSLLYANGDQTNFANAIGGLNPSAFLILSDGINNSGQDPIQIAKQKNIPIYTIKIGETPKDILISSVNLPKIVYAGDKIQIKVNIENIGFPSVGADSICEISIYDNNILSGEPVLGQKKVLLPQSGTQEEIEFKVSYNTPGAHLCRVEISELSGELSYANNKKDFGITILKSRIKVGWFGSPSWNFKFAALELSKGEKIEFSSRLKMQSGVNYYPPADSYDVVFLENCEFVGAGLAPAPLRGVIIIGKNFGNISPFIKLGSEYLVQFPIQVVKYQNVFNVTELPPVKIYQVNGLKSGAEVICATAIPLGRDDDNKPVIAKMNYGNTVVISIASNEVWKWSFNYQIKFWSNLVNLCMYKNIPKFWAESNRQIYNVGEKIIFYSQLYDDNYRPVSNSDIFANVYLITNNQPLTTDATVPFYSLGNGNYEGFIEFLPAGEYKYIVICRGEQLFAPTDSIAGSFKVTADLEFQNLTPDENFLQELAQASGGKYLTDINELNHINLKPQKSRIVLNLTNFWLFLILIIVLLSAEWILLRR